MKTIEEKSWNADQLRTNWKLKYLVPVVKKNNNAIIVTMLLELKPVLLIKHIT